MFPDCNAPEFWNPLRTCSSIHGGVPDRGEPSVSPSSTKRLLIAISKPPSGPPKDSGTAR